LRATKDYNLGILRPDLAREWHSTKNGELTPYQVTPGSERKVWWKCGKGHEWKASIGNRTKGRGCPYCSGKKPSEEYNLAVKYPSLIQEWHPTKNGDLTPYDVTPGSHKKIWWICKRGHEWAAVVASRSVGRGCPYCRNEDWGNLHRKALVKRSGSLADKYPQIASEWHPIRNGGLTPDQVTPGSGKKVWWICNRGHEWQSVIYSRTHGTGCPFCAPQTSKLEIRIYSELKTIFDNVNWREKVDGLECDVYLPSYRIGIEVDGYPWHFGEEEKDKQKGVQFLEKGVMVFRVRDRNLKKVAKTDVFYGETERHFLIIKRLLNKIMETGVLKTEKTKIIQYLDSNHLQNREEYRKIVSLLPSPLPEKSLMSLYPDLEKEWLYEKNKPLNPWLFTPGSHTKVWWVCKKGHEWKATIHNRTNGTGCPFCDGKRVGKDNNLAVSHPDLVKEWHPTKNMDLTPYDVMPKSHTKVWWKCKQGHEWKTAISHRVEGSGCPKCYHERRRSKLLL
jgi:hypothetical protein